MSSSGGFPINQPQTTPTGAVSEPTGGSGTSAAAGHTGAPGSGLFQCGSCKRTYTRLDHLARHVRSHTQDKPYKCQICTKRFARIDLLKRHVAGHDARPGDSRKTEASAGQDTNDDAGRVSQACQACAKMHLKCEEEKPCKRCRKRNIACKWNDKYHYAAAASTSEAPQDESSPPPDADASTSGPDDTPPSQPLQPGMSMSIPHRGSSASIQHPGYRPHPLQNRDYSEMSSEFSPMSAGIHPSGYASPAFNTGVTGMVPTDAPMADSSVMAAYLNNVVTNFNDPFHNGGFMGQGIPGTWTAVGLQPDGLLNEPTMELDEMDLSFLDSYNHHIPFQVSGSPSSTGTAAASGQSGLSSSTTAAAAAAISSDASDKAFRRLYWRFNPTAQDTGTSEEHNLSVDHEQTRINLERRTTAEKLSSSTRDKILAMVIETIKQENLARAMQSFPSVDLLDVLLQFYLTHPVARADNIFHLPTFNPNTKRPPLVAAMIAAGAVLTADTAAVKLGFAIQECARMIIPRAWEQDNSQIRDLQLVQGYFIILEVALWSGIPRKMEIAEAFWHPLLTMCRRGGKLRRTTYKAAIPVPTGPNATAKALDAAWRDWVEEESWKRLMLRMIRHDTSSSMTLLAPPLFSYAEAQFPLPDARECWMAPTAETWRQAYLSSASSNALVRQPALVDIVNDPDLLRRSAGRVDDLISALGFFCATWGMVWEQLQLSSLQKQNQQQQLEQQSYRHPAQPVRQTSPYQQHTLTSNRQIPPQHQQQWMPQHGELVESAVAPFLSRQDDIVGLIGQFTTSLATAQPPLPFSFDVSSAADVSLHMSLVLLHLNVSLEDVQLLAGAEGPEEARRVIPLLQEWAHSTNARWAVWHAGQILRAAKASVLMHGAGDKMMASSRQGTLRGPNAYAIYHASLALWVYSLLNEEWQGGMQVHDVRPGIDIKHEPGIPGTVPVWLDSDEAADSPDVQGFIHLGRGRPALRPIFPGQLVSKGRQQHPSFVQPVFLDEDPGGSMQVVIDLFRVNFEAGRMPRLVETLVQLMTGLQEAVRKAFSGRR